MAFGEHNHPNDCGRIFELKWFCSVLGLDDLAEVADALSSADKLCQIRMSQGLGPVLESTHIEKHPHGNQSIRPMSPMTYALDAHCPGRAAVGALHPLLGNGMNPDIADRSIANA